jgi:NAD(P)-dependent dehydrogenase (short-subunit alcohol dehydrogenase family)
MKRDKNFTWSRADFARPNFSGLKVAIVGGTGGIGRAFSRLLASRGASVVVVGQSFRDTDMPGIEFIKADLSLMREAQRVARLLPAEDLDLVIFTTGIMAGPTRERNRGEHRARHGHQLFEPAGHRSRDRCTAWNASGCWSDEAARLHHGLSR